MKTIIAILIVLTASVLASAQGSLISPQLQVQFGDQVKRHNMHITSDGRYYYTVNGGNADDGVINKYSLSGQFMASYPISLDMRTIMYNPQDESLYVSTYGQTIYKITNLNSGTYETKFDQLYDNGQAALALSPDGNYFYYLNAGTLKKFDFNTGTTIRTFDGLKSGANSDFTVAVDEQYIYTFDSDAKKIYVYDLDGNYVSSLDMPLGCYPFSLSVANGLLFSSADGNTGLGTWYGYKVKSAAQQSSASPELAMRFEDKIGRHNMHLTTDGSFIYTVNGGANDGEINKYNIKGEFVKKYTMPLDMRSIFFNPQDGDLYVCALDKGIYHIKNLESRVYEKKFSGLYDEEQAVLAASADGNYIYYFNSGSLKKFDFNSGNLLQTYSGLKFGASSALTVAVDYQYIYTFDSDNRTVYVYDLDANYVKTLKLPDGDFSFSLSTAIDLLFVAKDGNYATGTWYGYKVH